MSIDRDTANARPLQGEHTNHHPASAVTDRDVTLTSNQYIPAGTNPIAKTDKGDGSEQPATERDTTPPNVTNAATGAVTSIQDDDVENATRTKSIVRDGDVSGIISGA